MNGKLLFLMLLTFSAFTSWGQYENVWAFPDQAGLDFNGTAPVAIQSSSRGWGEAAASVCDINGQLLFYTEGDTLWDKNGDPMPNGQGISGVDPIILGFPGYPDYSATSSSIQGALIVPKPGDSMKYYVFSLSSFESADQGRLSYSIVDMSLNGGLGDVDTAYKAVALDSNLTERMTGITGNAHNVWVLVTPVSPSVAGTAMEFRAYELTADGLNTTPVQSNVTGTIGQSAMGRYIGDFAVSPDRKRLALSRMGDQRIELYDFDPESGTVSNQLVIEDALADIGVCFSPNSSRLYACLKHASLQQHGIYQFDLSTNTQAAIMASKTRLDSLAWNNGVVRFKIGPDKRVYYLYKTTSHAVLGRIEAPDATGAAAMNQDSFLLKATTHPYLICLTHVVPTFKFDHLELSACPEDYTLLTAFDTTGYGYEWNDQVTGKERTVTGTGVYWLRYHTMPYLLHTDTFRVSVTELDPMITVNGVILGTTVTYASYQWLLDGVVIAGADQQEYTVTENGGYQVIVTNEAGCIDTSDVYVVDNVSIQHLDGLADQIRVYPNPAGDVVYIQSPLGLKVQVSDLSGRVLKYMDAPATDISIPVAELQSGTYLIQLFNKQGARVKSEKLVKLNR